MGEVRTCDNREGEGREGPLSGAFLAWTKKRTKKSTPVGLFLRWQGQEFRKDMQCRGVGGLMGDLPNVTGRSKELQGPRISLAVPAQKKKEDTSQVQRRFWRG